MFVLCHLSVYGPALFLEYVEKLKRTSTSCGENTVAQFDSNHILGTDPCIHALN